MNGSKNFNYLIIVFFILFFSQSQSVYSASRSAPQEVSEKHFLDKTLVLKIDKDISLEDLISSSGYSLEDENTAFFLKDFMRLNTSIKSISLLKKGTVIRLPLKYLKSIGGHTSKTNASMASTRGEKKIFRKKEIEKTNTSVASTRGEKKIFRKKEIEKTNASMASRRGEKKIFRKKEIEKTHDGALTLNTSLTLRNIRTLFQSLGDNISIETEGLKMFDIGEKSELSLDKTFFPLIDLHNEHVLLLDYKGILSRDLKDLLEISWPEFRIVSYKEGMDLKNLLYVLLSESGYSVKKSEKIVIGGESQIEYYPDFLVFRKNDDFMESQFSFVSIIDHNAKKTPYSLITWLNNRGIRLVELSNQETEQYVNVTSKTSRVDNVTSNKEFAERILTLLKYDFSRDKTIDISHRKEFSFNIKADLSIHLDNKTKVLEFSGISEHEMSYAKKLGLDISYISPWEEKREIIRKIMTLLSLEFSNIPKTTSNDISPKNVRYRLLLPGVYATSRHEAFFFTDSELENNLLESIVNEKITIVKF